MVAAIVEHLAVAVEGVDGDLMKDALREAILEAAALGDEDGFSDLERGLQTFINGNGIEGFVEIFLCRFVFEAVWANIESYVQSKASDEASMSAFVSAIEGVCTSEVRGALDDAKESGTFEILDWFGDDGQRIGRGIFETISDRLRSMGGE